MQTTQNTDITQLADGIKYVTKRNGSMQPIDKEKIRKRLQAHSHGLNLNYINFDVIVKKVYDGIYTGKFYSH